MTSRCVACSAPEHRQALMERDGLKQGNTKWSTVRQSSVRKLARKSGRNCWSRSLAATLNCMSLDRSDVQYTAKGWKTLKKSCRYSRRVENMTWVMRAWQHDGMTVDLNSDGAKGPERKSTSGGIMMINGTVVKHWSRTQATRALSTAEAEYCAVVTGSAEGLGMQSMMRELGLSALKGVEKVTWTMRAWRLVEDMHIDVLRGIRIGARRPERESKM